MIICKFYLKNNSFPRLFCKCSIWYLGAHSTKLSTVTSNSYFSNGIHFFLLLFDSWFLHFLNTQYIHYYTNKSTTPRGSLPRPRCLYIPMRYGKTLRISNMKPQAKTPYLPTRWSEDDILLPFV